MRRYQSVQLTPTNYNRQPYQMVTYRVPFQLLALSTLLQHHAKIAFIVKKQQKHDSTAGMNFSKPLSASAQQARKIYTSSI